MECDDSQQEGRVYSFQDLNIDVYCVYSPLILIRLSEHENGKDNHLLIKSFSLSLELCYI
jgi:hypothetical protein